jgi:site-specific DNA-methyltransferase (adenine-specific)
MDQDTWFVSRVCGTFKERLNHPCQMPEAVLERIIRVASDPGDLVIDPFAGSGTTLAVAQKLGRRFLGCELSDEYAEGVRKRLNKNEVAGRKGLIPASRNRQKLGAGRPAG